MDSSGNRHPHLLKVPCREMVVVVPADRGLQRIDPWDPKPFEECHAGCALLVLLHCEVAESVLEVLVQLGEEVGELSAFYVVGTCPAPVHEYLLHSAVTVQVKDHPNTLLGPDLLDHLLGVVDLGLGLFVRSLPDSVQVSTAQGAAKVTMDHSIRIEHWDNFEDEPLSQLLCLLGVGDDEVQEPLEHPARTSLPRMDPCHDHYSPLFGVIVRGCDRQQLYPIPMERSCQKLPMKVVVLLLLNRLQLLAQMSVGVGIAVAEIHRVLRVLELILKAQCKIIILQLRVKLDAVFRITNIAPCPDPALLRVFESPLAICQYPIALVEESASFLVIQDIELVLPWDTVSDPEVEPVVIPFGVDITSQEEVVLPDGSFAHDVQVPRFDGRVEFQLIRKTQRALNLFIRPIFVLSKESDFGDREHRLSPHIVQPRVHLIVDY